MDFAEKYKKYREYFEGHLLTELEKMRKNMPSAALFSAMEYSLLCGGKRLRPVFYLAVYDFLTGGGLLNGWLSGGKPKGGGGYDGGDRTVAVDSDVAGRVACAIEMLHTYTLIHDDLPCLDNDDFRRGRPSCHKAFGEAAALLAGDALLNHSFSLLLEASVKCPSLAFSAYEFSVLTGCFGVIGGQAVEIDIMQKPEASVEISREAFIDIYKNKTAALFVGAALLAAHSAGRGDLASALKNFAENFGLAFQLKDDLSDNNKESFAHFFGKAETEGLVGEYTQKARCIAKNIGFEFLSDMTDFEKHI